MDGILMWPAEDQDMIDLTRLLNTEDVDLEEGNDDAGLLGL